jgi:hypothetical protein
LAKRDQQVGPCHKKKRKEGMQDQLTGSEPMLEQVVLPAFDPPSFAFNDQPKQGPTSPAEFFALHFPACIQKYGAAVLERRRVYADGTLKITPVSVNEDALASILGSKDCGETVWHTFERQFYQKDHRTSFFIPVEVEDLKLVLSQLFLKCIAVMPRCVDVQSLFNEFRSGDVLDTIIQRAKAVLGVGDDFFAAGGPNTRNPATVPKEAVRVFVDQNIVEDGTALLPLRDAFEAYQAFCKENSYIAVHINQFRPFIAPCIQKKFNRGVRNDLNTFGASKALGWRGVKLRSVEGSE